MRTVYNLNFCSEWCGQTSRTSMDPLFLRYSLGNFWGLVLSQWQHLAAVWRLVSANSWPCRFQLSRNGWKSHLHKLQGPHNGLTNCRSSVFNLSNPRDRRLFLTQHRCHRPVGSTIWQWCGLAWVPHQWDTSSKETKHRQSKPKKIPGDKSHPIS